MDNNNLNTPMDSVKEGAIEEHPEWMTSLIGQLSFCPECGQETLLSDGIKSICTNCGYQR